jgi:hypothetical protein
MNTRNLALCGLLAALVLLAMFGLNHLAQASNSRAAESPAAPAATLASVFYDLDGVDFTSPVDGWLLQDGGEVYQFDGATWRQTTDLEGAEEMHELEMYSSIEGWATGYSEDFGSGTTEIFWHYTGSNWIPMEKPVEGRINDIDLLSPTEGWATNSDVDAILRYNGTSWAISLQEDGLSLGSISAAAANDAWAVGASGIYHFNGAEWEQFSPDDSLNSVDMIDASNGWAVGDDGVIKHYTGTAWVDAASPVTQTLGSLSLLPDGSAGWASGGRLIECTGDPPTQTCTYESWTVYFDGAEWQEAPFPFNDRIDTISIASADEAWATGDQEYLYRFVNGAWTQAAVFFLRTEGETTGGPGSFFDYFASGFDANSTLDVCVNRNRLGQVTASEAGSVGFGIQTAGEITPGAYSIVVGPSACPTLAAAGVSAVDALIADQLFNIQAGAPVIPVPAGYADDILDLSSDVPPLAPSLAVTKTAVVASVAAPGAPVTFTVRVDNSGDGNLTLTSMDDSQYGNVALGTNTQISSTTCLVPRGLAQGDFYACQFVAAVSGTAGTTHINQLTVTATTAITSEVSDEDSAEVSIIETAGASLTVTKTVVGPAPADSWSFIGPSGTFTLPAAGGSRLIPDLAPGTYAITETVKAGYTAAVTCSDGSSGAASVAVNLAAGIAVGCTFTNTHGGTDLNPVLFLPSVNTE